MKKISEPVVFFGSGPVAAESLRKLHDDFEIEAVVTKPRPAHHTGSVPVLELAAELGLNTYTVATKQELNTLIADNPFRSRLGVLIDFGIIVSQTAIDYFELGIVNSHFSLLPEWRGADPITFAVLSGQAKTGVSLMLLTAGMDEGPILAASEYALSSTMTAQELTEALIAVSHNLLTSILPVYVAGSLVPMTQEANAAMLGISAEPTYSRKLTKQDGALDYTKPADVLEREIRAFLEWPKSKLRIGEIDVIITAARATNLSTHKKPGEIEVLSEPSRLNFYCASGYLSIDKLKPVGKNEMTIAEFIRGYGSRF